MKSWGAILLPLAVALIGLAEFLPRLMTGTFGTPQVLGLMIIGICLGVAGAAAQARFKARADRARAGRER
ncbi:MAG: hypothetical protein ACRD1C_12850 [Terriglobales bacterium]